MLEMQHIIPVMHHCQQRAAWSERWWKFGSCIPVLPIYIIISWRLLYLGLIIIESLLAKCIDYQENWYSTFKRIASLSLVTIGYNNSHLNKYVHYHICMKMNEWIPILMHVMPSKLCGNIRNKENLSSVETARAKSWSCHMWRGFGITNSNTL